MLNGYDETKVGTLFTKPEDFSEEYKKYDVNLIPKDDDKNQNNGDNNPLENCMIENIQNQEDEDEPKKPKKNNRYKK